MSFLTGRLSVLAALALSVSLAAGCAGASSAVDADPSAQDDNEGEFSQDIVKAQTDAKVKAEIEEALKGANFTSESDFPFHYLSATLATKLSADKAVTETLVRKELASFVDKDPDTDKPLAKLVGMTTTFTSWKKDFTPASGGCSDDVSPSAADCAAVTKMNAALAKNLRGIKVYYFGRAGTQGHVDGVAVSVIIVGRTPSGNLAGVRTIAIWT
jgi:Nuclease A inhibitor-like protein